MNNYYIKDAHFTPDKIKETAAIHRIEINQGFLSSLGNRALELMFSFASESKNAVLLNAIEKNSGRTIGFLLGTFNTGAFYREFLMKKSL